MSSLLYYVTEDQLFFKSCYHGEPKTLQYYLSVPKNCAICTSVDMHVLNFILWTASSVTNNDMEFQLQDESSFQLIDSID